MPRSLTTPSPMLWYPDNHLFGDITIITVGTEYHLFSEMFELDAQGQVRPGRIVGHAVSRDLVQWEMLPPAIRTGPEGAFDAFSIFHMDVFVHEGVWWMYYTGLDIRGPGQQQVVALATSRDGIIWEKHPDNPVLRADPRFYEPAIPREATYQEKDFGRLWFRDPCIIRDPQTGRFGMIVIARDQARPLDVRGCIAWAESPDLVRWEPKPPIFSPGRFHTIETPSIFERHGRHYLIYMTHPAWGIRPLMSDPYQDAGNFYAVSDTGWTGPYVAPSDEVLVAAHRNMRFGAQRIVEGPDGQHYLYGWLNTKPHADDEARAEVPGRLMPLPKRIQFRDDGSTRPMYNPVVDSFAGPSVEQALALQNPGQGWSCTPNSGAATGKSVQGRSVALTNLDAENFILTATVDLRQGERAGVVIRADDAAGGGLYIVADQRHQRMEFGRLDGPHFLDARACAPPRRFQLRIVACGVSIEIYMNDWLVMHQVRHRERGQRIGLMVEDGEAIFSDLTLRAL